MPNFLYEILVEEIPHGVLPSISQYIQTQIPQLFTKYGLHRGETHYFITPRRIGFLINDLPNKGQGRQIEQKGPSVKVAYDEQGNPTKALQGFFTSYNVTKNDIVEKEIKGQKYIFVQKTEEGVSLVDILPNILQELMQGFHFSQPMKWNYQGKTYEFIRPIRGITALINQQILPVSFFGLQSDRILFGHRQLYPNPISLDHANNYEETLKQNGCIANFDLRKQKIQSETIQLAQEIQGEALLDEELLSILTSLTEYPFPLRAEFDPSFLSLPKEVLISEMKIHQKYVPIIDSKGNLLPFYIITANIPYEDPTTKSNILTGNNRVLKARFADGKFFFEEDSKKGLDFLHESLSSISFVEGAGSIGNKVERMKQISLYLKDLLDPKLLEKDLFMAVKYAKADLGSLMVGEFPELQGIIGSYYAENQGMNKSVALAIKEHYYPMNLDGKNLVPTQTLSAIVGLADRLDNLFTLYAVGKTVTGSRDPYALRRQTIAIVNILLQYQWTNFSLEDLFKHTIALYKPFMTLSEEEWKTTLKTFIKVRLEGILKSAPFEYSSDTLNASLINIDYLLEDITRAGALQKVRTDYQAQFSRLSELAKRIANILKDQIPQEFKEELLIEQEEKDLYQTYKIVSQKIKTLPYDQQLLELITMEETIAKFFNSIMVKTGDEKEINRISLLNLIYQLFIEQADFSKLS